MAAPAPTELDRLMARLADGDRSVFKDIFHVLWPPVHRLCLGVLRHSADADDGAQLAMIKIMSRASDYDRTRPALPWALAVATWECRTILRKRQRAREMVGKDPAEDCAEATVPEHSDPERNLDERKLIESALRALDELSGSDQTTLLASFWEESDAATGAAARKRKQRATERLRQAWRRLYSVG